MKILFFIILILYSYGNNIFDYRYKYNTYYLNKNIRVNYPLNLYIGIYQYSYYINGLTFNVSNGYMHGKPLEIFHGFINITFIDYNTMNIMKSSIYIDSIYLFI